MVNVLIVEGDPTAADLAIRFFSYQGYDTRRILDRNAAFFLAEANYGMVLIDFNTGGMGQDQFLDRIKAQWPEAVLVFTAFKASTGDAARLGIQYVLPKPFNVEQLTAFLVGMRLTYAKF